MYVQVANKEKDVANAAANKAGTETHKVVPDGKGGVHIHVHMHNGGK